jgi:multidrug efflux pump subunit AcrA (membrane-fusion protein)
MPQNNLVLRSTELQDIVSRKPGFLINWGIPIFFFILFGIALGSWFIKFPDIVPATARVNAVNPPKEIIANNTGKLAKLFKNDGAAVNAGDIIGYIENNAAYNEVIKLSAILDTLQYFTNSLKLEELPAYWNSNYSNFNNLGELQQPHQTFMQTFVSFKDYLSSGFYLAKKKILLNDLLNTKKLLQTLYHQKGLQQEDLMLTGETFNVHDTLHNEHLINDVEYRSQKSQFIGKKMTIPQMNASIINNQSQQNAINKEILELDNQISQQKGQFAQALNSYRALVGDWKRKYLLTAPETGTLVINGFLTQGEFIQQNQVIGYVANTSSAYFVEMLISQHNSGKVKPGQEVLLKFESYPYQEFGMLTGKIKFIKPLPTDSGYFSQVDLPNGLITTNKKQLIFKNGMRAGADIIVDNKRLTARFFNSLTDLFK